MDYAALIEHALSTLDGQFSLAELLRRVDALNNSVPTLEELNAAFAQIQRGGQFASRDWSPVTSAAYNKAVSQNWEWMTQMLESQGISRIGNPTARRVSASSVARVDLPRPMGS
jgi:hypothetical protein